MLSNSNTLIGGAANTGTASTTAGTQNNSGKGNNKTQIRTSAFNFL